MQNWVNVIHVYTHKIGRMESGEWRIKSGEWNSRLHRRNPPPRVEEDRANGIRVYTNETRLRGLK